MELNMEQTAAAIIKISHKMLSKGYYILIYFSRKVILVQYFCSTVNPSMSIFKILFKFMQPLITALFVMVEHF